MFCFLTLLHPASVGIRSLTYPDMNTRLLLAKKFTLKLFKRAIQENTFLEEYVEVKEENIEIFEEINEGLVIEEKPEIKIVEEIKKDHIIEKDLEIKMAETIEEEIVKEFNKIESNDYQYQDPFILVVSDTLKFIDFIGVDKFHSIVGSYLVNQFLLGKFLQLHEDQGKGNSN